MTLHTFHHSIPPSSRFEVSHKEPLFSQLTRVLRAEEGMHLRLVDGRGKVALATLIKKEKGTLTLEIQERAEHPRPKELRLYMPLTKPSTIEETLGMATQLGVTHINFLQTEYSQVAAKAYLESEKKQDRLQRILTEHAEQSEQSWFPELNFDVYTLEQLDLSKCVALIERDNGGPQSLETKTSLILGPEGGWSPKEKELLKNSTVTPLSLGPSVLRVATAAVCGLYELQKTHTK